MIRKKFTRHLALLFITVGYSLVGVAGCTEVRVACPKISLMDGVYPSEVFSDGVIKFEESGDRHNPLAAVLYRGKETCSKLVFDKYDLVGAPPKVGSVFPYTVHGVKNLFVIITWATDHSGLGIKGTSYQVYAYQDDGSGGLRENDAISNANQMFGIEGMEDFKDSHFFGKNPAEVKQLVDKLGLK